MLSFLAVSSLERLGGGVAIAIAIIFLVGTVVSLFRPVEGNMIVEESIAPRFIALAVAIIIAIYAIPWGLQAFR